jgi:hypothetical protein
MVAERMRRRASHKGGPRPNPTEWVEEFPFASVTVMFGIGLGVGFVLGHTLAEAAGRKMFHEDTLAEKLTCQIRDVLKNTLPEQFSQYVS